MIDSSGRREGKKEARTIFEMLEEAARRGDDYVDGRGQRLLLDLELHAGRDAGRAELHVTRQALYYRLYVHTFTPITTTGRGELGSGPTNQDLLGQLPVGKEDEAGRPFGLGLHAGLLVGVQQLEQRQKIGQRLARSFVVAWPREQERM
jgi:hypothetical protein